MTAHFLMVCRHRPGLEALRAATRDAHRRHVATGGGGLARVLIGSALVAADGSAIGNFGIMEAADREAVAAFAAADPYATAGLVESVEITALPAGFQAHRIDPMTPAPS